VFARDRLLPSQQSLCTPEVNDHVAELDTLDNAVDDLVDAVLEFLVLAPALRLTDLVDDHLFRRLRRNAAEIDRRQRLDQEIADRERIILLLRHSHADLGRLVLDRFDDQPIAGKHDLPAGAVNARADVVLVSVLGAASLLDRLLHRFQDLIAVDVLVPGHGLCDLQQLRTRVHCARFGSGTGHGSALLPVGVHCPLNAKRSSVKTSFARAMSANGSSTVPLAAARRTASPFTPSSRP